VISSRIGSMAIESAGCVPIFVTGERFSELVAQKITEARLNESPASPDRKLRGAVQFPAMYPAVMTVSAVGKLAIIAGHAQATKSLAPTDRVSRASMQPL